MDKLTLITGPSIEPLTTAEAKVWLRLEIATEDDLIAELITTARVACETRLRQSLITTTWKAAFDQTPIGPGYYNRSIRAMGEGPQWLPTAGGGEFVLPRPPLISVTSIEYLDTASTLQTIDPSLYTVSAGTPGRVQPILGTTWPIPAPVVDAVRITFTAGYGSTAASVPAPIKHAIRALVAYYYENREAMGTIPEGIADLLSASDHGCYA